MPATNIVIEWVNHRTAVPDGMRTYKTAAPTKWRRGRPVCSVGTSVMCRREHTLWAGQLVPPGVSSPRAHVIDVCCNYPLQLFKGSALRTLNSGLLGPGNKRDAVGVGVSPTRVFSVLDFWRVCFPSWLRGMKGWRMLQKGHIIWVGTVIWT